MIRLSGILLGIALALGFLVAVVGIPLPRTPAVTVEAAIPLDEPLPAPPAEPVRPAPATAPEPGPAEPETAGQPATGPDVVEADAPETVEAAARQAPEDAAEAINPQQPLRWHAFWSPFRSRVAANGFVAGLSRVTGLDYRVVAVRPGVYEVAFGYADEAEIEENLAAIRAATGLDTPEP